MARNSEKLSVAFLFDDTLDSTDGVAQQVKILGEYLSRAGHKVVYLCGQTSTREWAGGRVYSLSKNIQVRFNGNRLSMPLFSSGKKIKQVLQDEKPDVLHVMTPYSPLMAQRVIAKAYRRNIAVVASFHILPSGRISSIGAWLLSYAQFFSLKKVEAFTSTSRDAAVFAKHAMRINSVVVPNTVDINKFKPGQKQKKIKGRVVFLGRLVGRKGCEQLIRAFCRLTASHPEVTLIIAGSGPDRSHLERLTARLGLSDKVKFLGFIREEDKPKLLGSAEIACFPSLYGESFGLVLIEAMAAGAEVVLGGNNPGYKSVLDDGPGLLINPNDTEMFTARLAEFVDNQAARQKAAEWQKTAVKQYDIDVIGPRMESIYRSAIARAVKNSHNKAHE